MAKVKILNINQISNGEMKQVTIDNLNYLVAKIDGKIYIASDLCTHEDAELTMGCLDGTRVKCPLHGSYFDLSTGKPINEPAEEPITIYSPLIEDGVIYINEK